MKQVMKQVLDATIPLDCMADSSAPHGFQPAELANSAWTVICRQMDVPFDLTGLAC